MKKCCGCGIALQVEKREELGYSTNLENDLCERCFKLRHYGVYQKVPFDNQHYQKILSSIPKDNLVVYVTDCLSLDIFSIEQFTRVVLVVTKRDILPLSTKKEKIISYVKKMYSKVMDVFFVSGKKGDGLESLYHYLVENSLGKNIYIVGVTNSGKSTLINQLVSLYGDNTNNMVTVSMYPSTTLNMVEVHLKNLVLIDTPGLINENSITNYLNESDIKKITPKKPLKPKSCQIEGNGSIVIDRLVRIDYEAKKRTSMVIYVARDLEIRFASFKKKYLRDLKKHYFNLEKGKDVIIPGLGFIKCVGEVSLTIYTIEGVIPVVRDNFL